jgi:hypothetical protein
MTCMTITYGDGRSLDAVLLSRTSDEVRVLFPGDEDVRSFTSINRRWISEECESVVLQFAWNRSHTALVPTEEKCVCCKRLASRLISALRSGSDGDQETEGDLCAFAMSADRVRLPFNQFGIH